MIESNNNGLNLNLNNLFKGVESETEALERISSLLKVPKEEVPSQFVDMVMRGIDGFGPIVFLVTDVPRNPRKFTDEEILKYAPRELLERRAKPMGQNGIPKEVATHPSDMVDNPSRRRFYDEIVETEAEALERLSRLLGMPKEEIPFCFVDMVMKGIDNSGPVQDILGDFPKNPRRFTDEEILKYATKERLEEHNRIMDKITEILKAKEGVIPPGKWDMSMTEGIITEPSTGRLMNPPPMFDDKPTAVTVPPMFGDKPTAVTVPPMFDGIPVKKPIDELKERHPDFFDENDELRQSAVEVIELLFQNYEEAKRQEQVQEKDEPQPQVPSVF